MGGNSRVSDPKNTALTIPFRVVPPRSLTLQLPKSYPL